MNSLSIKDLQELAEIAKTLNISSVNELIKLIENTNVEVFQKKEEIKIRKWGIIIGSILSIIYLSGAIALTILASSTMMIVLALIFATFVFAGGTFALSSMQSVSTKDYAEMVRSIVQNMNEENKTPLNIPIKNLKSPEHDLIEADLSQEHDGNK